MEPVRLPGRVLQRSLPAEAPHFWRDKGQWCCRSRLGPWGYGADVKEAYEDWKHARLQWARDVPPAKRIPLLMAPLGQFPTTEHRHVHPT